MPEIQEQVDQFVSKHHCITTVIEAMQDDLDALLRQFMEECCEAVKYTVGDQESHAIVDNIHILFAWLLEGE